MSEDTHTINDCWNQIGVWRNSDEKCPKLSDVIHCYNCDIYSNAGRQLLNRDIPDGYDKEWASVLASEKKPANNDMVSAIVFRLGAEWLSLPVSMINEITMLRSIYDIPHNNNHKIRGMVNIRGELIICMSLGNLLGVEKPDEDLIEEEHSINRLIMIRDNKGYIVFPVSEICGIMHYNSNHISPPPDTIKKSRLDFMLGITDFNDRSIGCIDHIKLLENIQDTLK